MGNRESGYATHGTHHPNPSHPTTRLYSECNGNFGLPETAVIHLHQSTSLPLFAPDITRPLRERSGSLAKCAFRRLRRLGSPTNTSSSV